MFIRRLLNPKIAYHRSASLNEFLMAEPWVLAIGNFDGVHLGHQLLIRHLQDQAQKIHARTAVMVFEPQPLEYFKGDQAPLRIMSARDKVEALFNQGVELVLLCRFEKSLSVLSPDEFMASLRANLNVRGLTIGRDFRFGLERRGDLAYLQSYCSSNALDLVDMPDFTASQVRVSSSLIRGHIEHARFTQAGESLGHPYMLTGKVVHGKKLGRTLGFPTANVKLRRRVPPIQGVFVGRAYLPYNDQAQSFQAVANCGYKPSICGRFWQVEVHIFDSSFQAENVYGLRLGFEPLALLRHEKQFGSLEELSAAIAKDVKQAQDYFLK